MTKSQRLIQVQHRQSYGKHRIYPVNATARALAVLLLRSTFTDEQLSQFEALGFEIQWIPQGEEPEQEKEKS